MQFGLQTVQTLQESDCIYADLGDILSDSMF